MRKLRLTLTIVLTVTVSSCLPETDAFLFGTGHIDFQHLDIGYKVLRAIFSSKESTRNCNTDIENNNQTVGRGINGGFSCGACTILVSLAEQLTQLNNETAEASLRRMCTFLPVKYQSSCDFLVQAVAPVIAEEIVANSSPDTICYKLRICYVDEGKQMCHLFPIPTLLNEVNVGWKDSPVESIVPERYRKFIGSSTPWICKIPGVSELCAALDNVYDKLTPFYDFDGDKFSGVDILRGAIWRGRDCNDFNKDIRPGRRSLDDDREVDSNCNGIFGINVTSGRPWEEELCWGSGQRGVIYVGDSVGAHFHAPPAWFTPADLTTGIWDNLTYVVGNEGDWPDLGFATGFRDSQMPALISGGPTDSIYLRLRNRNLCNHRDYQNLARNGDNSNDTLAHMLSLSRMKTQDHPAIVFYSLIGNDVCNEHVDTVTYMTTAKQFKKNTMTTLEFLEKHLPPNSHVILVGLIDGSILYNAMAHRYHPLGELNKNVKYTDMYRWFNCMEMGPCHGWMTSNSTLRRITTKHARRLTRVLQHVAESERFDSFDIHFVENPFKQVINDWLDQGREVWELIEPVDSLHPTQAAQSFIAEELWSRLEKDMPEVLGPINDRNPVITQLFGDQGGH